MLVHCQLQLLLLLLINCLVPAQHCCPQIAGVLLLLLLCSSWLPLLLLPCSGGGLPTSCGCCCSTPLGRFCCLCCCSNCTRFTAMCLPVRQLLLLLRSSLLPLLLPCRPQPQPPSHQAHHQQGSCRKKTHIKAHAKGISHGGQQPRLLPKMPCEPPPQPPTHQAHHPQGSCKHKTWHTRQIGKERQIISTHYWCTLTAATLQLLCSRHAALD